MLFLKLQFFLFHFLMQNGYRYHWKTLMIELCLHIKKLFGLFSRKAEIFPNLENQRLLHLEFQCQKLLSLYLYPLILQRFIYKTVRGL